MVLFNGFTKQKIREKTEYRGDYRVIGVVISSSDRSVIGFKILNIGTLTSNLVTKVQMVSLLARVRFENVKLMDGLVITNDLVAGPSSDYLDFFEHSIQRFPQFNEKGVLISEPNFIIILGQVVNESNPSTVLGYRVYLPDGTVKSIREDVLLERAKKNVQFVNAKFVESKGGKKPYIASISGSFKSITLVEEEEVNLDFGKRRISNELQEQHRRGYRVKIVSRLVKNIFSYGVFRGTLGERDYDILKREILPELFLDGILEVTEDAHTLTNIVAFACIERDHYGVLEKEYPETLRLYKVTSPKFDSKTNKPTVRQDFRTLKISSEVLNLLSIKGYVDSAKVLDYLKKLISLEEIMLRRVNTDLVEKMHIRNKYIAHVAKQYRTEYTYYNVVRLSTYTYNPATFDYTSESTLEEFGFTLDTSKVGMRVGSRIYRSALSKEYPRHSQEKYKYIHNNNGEGLVELKFGLDFAIRELENAQLVVNRFTCFGDMKITEDLARFKYLLGYLGGSTSRNAEYYRTKLKHSQAGYAFVLALHNPELLEELCKQNIVHVDFDIDVVSKTDYALTQLDILYYQSGCMFSCNKDIRVNESWSWSGFADAIPVATRQALVLNHNSVDYTFGKRLDHGYTFLRNMLD